MVTINTEKCIGCGLCVKDCFSKVLSVKDGKATVAGDCLACGHCVAVCPQNAVSIPALPMEDVREYDDSCKLDAENLLHFMQFRRSVRQFKSDSIPKETLATILEAGRYTPTACNQQDVSYIVVQDELKEIKPILWATLEKALEIGKMGPYAPLLQPLYDEHKADPSKDMLFCNANALVLVLTENPMNNGLAANAIELMAQASGVGVLFSGFLQAGIMAAPGMKERLGIKENQQISAAMLMGIPAVTYRRTAPRKKANITWK